LWNFWLLSRPAHNDLRPRTFSALRKHYPAR
jgi:hypothetical protein